MVCPYCHIEYATSEGFKAHVKSCFYKENPENPLPIPENEEKQIKKVRKKSNTANKVGE